MIAQFLKVASILNPGIVTPIPILLHINLETIKNPKTPTYLKKT
jgi:hypothetical protein